MTTQQMATLRRIGELLIAGYSPELAEKKAREEARRRSPQHRAAVARRLALADARFQRTGNFRM